MYAGGSGSDRLLLTPRHRSLPRDAKGRLMPRPALTMAKTEHSTSPAIVTARKVSEWARSVHEEGFAALDTADYCANAEVVEAVRAQVLRRYESFLAQAGAKKIDLSRVENAERLAGFYVREGGRVDMQLWTSAVQTLALDFPVAPVDVAPLLELAHKWQPVLVELFAAHEDAKAEVKSEPSADGYNSAVKAETKADGKTQADGASFALEYIGCVLSRPGDGDQNWHLDGVHRNLSRHEPADRVNVFVPLVAIDEETGGTEMKSKSHFRNQGRGRGGGSARFEAYEHLESVTHSVAAGTPIVMDYRVWHRGLANTSADTIRPLLYFKYALRRAPAINKRASADESGVANGGKKRKRILPVPV